MGKFAPNKVLEYNFASLERVVHDVMQEIKDGNNITLMLTCDEIPDYLAAFLSTGTVKPIDIAWSLPEINGYEGEYWLSLISNTNGKAELYVESAWDDKREQYYPVEIGENAIFFVSQNISKNFYDVINNGINDIVLFQIEK